MTPTAVTARSVSEAELLYAAARHHRVEVVDGQLIITDIEAMHPIGGLHIIVGENLHDILKPFARQNQLGYVFGDGLLYLLDKDDSGLKGARVPDLSFIRKTNLRTAWDVQRPYPGFPDLAVEIVSPGDEAEELSARVSDFLNAGTDEVWVIYPNRRELLRYRRDDNAIRRYQADDLLDAAPLFPGLVFALDGLFTLPEELT
ncbi:MAG: Uma2 family endonuclease [bacterium]|nr:Uma2 family endonuclease [bacterium]